MAAAFTSNYSGDDQSAAQMFLLLQAIINGQVDVPVHRAEPAKPRLGRMVVADGTDWDPLSAGVPRLVWYNGSAWVALDA